MNPLFIAICVISAASQTCSSLTYPASMLYFNLEATEPAPVAESTINPSHPLMCEYNTDCTEFCCS